MRQAELLDPKNVEALIPGAHTMGGGDALLAVHPQTPAHVTYSSGAR